MFTAAWCTACKMFKPIFIDLADENRNKGILLGMVDTEAQKELARELNIRSLPTLIIFHQGAPVYRGNMLPKMRLQELFDTLIEKNSQ